MKNATKSTATKSTATVNATATNTILSVEKINALYNELIVCKTKHALVDTLNKYGLRTTTIPTDTPNVNDLYIQLCDKSRVLFGAKSLKVYTNESHATALSMFTFDRVNDGSYRTRRATVAKTVDNFKTVFEYFAKNGCIEKLPTTV
jgi:hypothetical protein